MPAYLKLENLSGDVKDARYRGWIELESVNFGPPNAGRASSRATNREVKSSTTSTVLATIRAGGVTVDLLQATVEGTPLGKAIIVLDNGQPGGTRGFVMENALLSSYQLGGSRGDALPMVSFSLDGFDLTLLTEAQLSEILKPAASPSPRRRR